MDEEKEHQHLQQGSVEDNGPAGAEELVPLTQKEEDVLAPADIPIANVLRIMKAALPPSAKIAKEAKECVQECISEFIAFITSEASEKCLQEKRKTVNGEDILFAMTSLGFENYSETLKIYLAKYRDSVKQADHDPEEPADRARHASVSYNEAGEAQPKPKRSHKKRKVAPVTETNEAIALQQGQAAVPSQALDPSLAEHNTTW